MSKKAHHTIESLEATSGFLKGCRFEFADGLNCIIGGRGTGKTTVLEFIRHTLASTSARRSDKLIAGNLGSGRVRLSVRTKHGVGYVAERTAADATQVFDGKGEPTGVSLDRDLIFKADIYSQNEIEEIATTPSHQLALLDRFIDEDIRGTETELHRIARALEDNAVELVRLVGEIRDLEDTVRDGQAVEEKLKGLLGSAGPAGDVVKQAHAEKTRRDRERKIVELLRGDLRKAKADFDTLASSTGRRLAGRIDGDLLAGPNEDVFAFVGDRIRQLVALVESTAATVAQRVDTTEIELAQKEEILAQRHAKQEADYRVVVEQSNEESGRAEERARLQKRLADVTAARQDIEIRRRELREREEQRRSLVAQLNELRDDRFQRRKAVAEYLTANIGALIRVSVLQAGDAEHYRALLTDALKGSNLKYNLIVDRIVSTVAPDELAKLVQSGNSDRLAERAGIAEDRARRVIECLRNTKEIFAIETVELADRPRIELCDGEYKDSSALSTGQRCTTILPILLLDSERPLIVDQPEDNLDNKFIYETVVTNIKGAKGNRQLIFVTHNPNIPVLGDAERVFVLKSDGKKGWIAHQGTVDELKDEIEIFLEGGKEAFRLRQKRYGY